TRGRGGPLARLRDGAAAITLHPANFGICVKERDVGLGEHGGHGRLAHADRSGQRDLDHGLSPAISAAASWRGASWPNNSMKLAAACSTSMAIPSKVARPRSRAARRSSVFTRSVTRSNTQPSGGSALVET